MASFSDRELRRLAKIHRITFLPQLSSTNWPSAHRQTFENIQKIGRQEFERFCSPIDIHSGEQPWKGPLKHRAEWLTKTAARLFKQDRNEADWRFHIENDVFLRLRVEVACPKCRARIWRSEIEVSFARDDCIADELELRKKNRVPCHCPPADRAHDFYEVGLNPLFNDRVQKEIKHDPSSSHILPRQAPDRIFGLQQTRNLENLLSQPLATGSADNTTTTTVGNSLRTSPFKDEEDPLIFPFLIVEAKSEKSTSGFDAIQAQTAFPIWALLNLQKNLRDRVKTTKTQLHPFVWFLANRGDCWRVYGCFITDSHPVKYDVVHLWDGSLLSQDSTLQLLMIVDYIFDWARDSYRPSILRQLKSVGTGEDYDTVSLAKETNIFSAHSRINDWVPRPPSDILGVYPEFKKTSSVPMTDHHNLSHIGSTESNLILRRSALTYRSRFVGLCLTKQNLEGFFKCVQIASSVDDSVSAAAELLRLLFAHVSEAIRFTREELISWEGIWSGNDSTDDASESCSWNESFHVLFSFATFINNSWDIVHELTYLAVADDALDQLNEHADYPLTETEIDSVKLASRPCEDEDLIEALDCLQTPSPAQLLLAAISCTSFSPFSRAEQEQRCTMGSIGIGVSNAGNLRRSLLRNLVQKYHKLQAPKDAQPCLDVERLPNPALPSMFTTYVKRTERDPDESFIRTFEYIQHHNPYRTGHQQLFCTMCRPQRREQRKTKGEEDFPWANPWASQVEISDQGMVLVESLCLNNQYLERRDSCVYMWKDTGEFEDLETLVSIVNDLRGAGKVYHTFLHSL